MRKTVFEYFQHAGFSRDEAQDAVTALQFHPEWQMNTLSGTDRALVEILLAWRSSEVLIFSDSGSSRCGQERLFHFVLERLVGRAAIHLAHPCYRGLNNNVPMTREERFPPWLKFSQEIDVLMESVPQ